MHSEQIKQVVTATEAVCYRWRRWSGQ